MCHLCGKGNPVFIMPPQSLEDAVGATQQLFADGFEGRHPVGQEMCEQILKNQLAIMRALAVTTLLDAQLRDRARNQFVRLDRPPTAVEERG